MSLKYLIYIFLTLFSKSRVNLAAEFVYSECGGVVDATIGEISYKANVQFLPNERCIWVIRVPNATGYSVGLTSAGFPLSNETRDHQVLVKGFGGEFGSNRYTVALKSMYAYDLSGSPVLAVTFHTGSENNSSYLGFKLQYIAYFTGGSVTPVSNVSVDIWHSSTSDIIRHPRTGSYSNNEISTFIFVPKQQEVEYKVAYVKEGLEESTCKDALYVYFFQQTSTSIDKWRFQGSLCGDVNIKLFNHTDVTMIIFLSDAEAVNNGFHLAYLV